MKNKGHVTNNIIGNTPRSENGTTPGEDIDFRIYELSNLNGDLERDNNLTFMSLFHVFLVT